MTSMFSTNRPSPSFRNEPREIQSKKEALSTLENALKKRINELKELCLKEGELTGHLPIDYPLQPREPIPQVRRKIGVSNNNCASYQSGTDATSSISSTKQHFNSIQNHHATNGTNINFIQSRPTSTNSTSSSLSTASSSNHRTTSNYHMTTITNGYPIKPLHTSYSHPSSLSTKTSNGSYHVTSVNRPPTLPSIHQLDKKSTISSATFTQDIDSLGHVRASSTTSSASSSGSAASSTLSAPVASQFKVPYGVNNIHFRSNSESWDSEPQANNGSLPNTANSYNRHLLNTALQSKRNLFPINKHQPSSSSATTLGTPQPPPRPPRGLNSIGNLEVSSKYDQRVLESRPTVGQEITTNEKRNCLVNDYAADSETGEHLADPLKALHLSDVNKKPKPYLKGKNTVDLDDLYKQSLRHRNLQRNENNSPVRPKTTKQLQDDVSKLKNSLKYSSCDDHIQASVKLIERSGQKFFEATAKAIAGNPALAEKLNNILPNNAERY